jgi:phytoene desaturase
MSTQKAAIIGAGVGGLAIAIRLAAKGYHVSVFEQQGKVGGKLNELNVNGFRFDTGPSLFTLPELVDEILAIGGEIPSNVLPYKKLDVITKYFFPDGKVLNAFADPQLFANEVLSVLNEPKENIEKYLLECRELYRLTANLFIYNEFPTWNGFKSAEAREIGKNIGKLKAFSSMHSVNKRSFTNSNTIQLFDRFATYNGSNPYKAPGTLTIIPHLEHNVGAFFPDKGMYSIASSLEALAIKLGVTFHLNAPVQEIVVQNGKAVGVKANGQSEAFDLVVNDTDIFTAYPKLLPKQRQSWVYKRQEPSSSALIFYWGVKGNYPQLDIHNILFSGAYKSEFDALGKGTILSDPTVYLFISSKQVANDAPSGHENWFVMVNAPYNREQDWCTLVAETRAAIVRKIKTVLNIDIESQIVNENVLTPPQIEQLTGSYRGSLYGISSNSPMAAFSRHPNRLSKIKGLYFAGGSVHPGGGIPLCLASAKIIDSFIPPVNRS